MSGFEVQPHLVAGHVWWFAALMAFGLALQIAFSPRRRERMGTLKFALASALVSAPAAAGVTMVRGAYRLGYRDQGQGFFEANMRSMVWMMGAIMVGQLAVRYAPPMSWLVRDLRRADRDIWRERLGRWFGKKS